MIELLGAGQRPWKIGFFVALVVSLLWFSYVSGWYNRFLDTGVARESNDGSSVLETARTPSREESAGSFAAAPSAPVGHMPPTLKLTPAMQQAPPPVSRSTIFPQPTLPAVVQVAVPHTPVATGMAVPSQLMVTPIASPRRTATPSPTPSSTLVWRTHRSNGAKQRLTSISVRQGRARSLPSYNHSRRYWRRLFHLPQGRPVLATGSVFIDKDAREPYLVWLLQAGVVNGANEVVHGRL